MKPRTPLRSGCPSPPPPPSRGEIIAKIKYDLTILSEEATFYGKNGGDYGDPGEEGMNHAHARIIGNLRLLA